MAHDREYLPDGDELRRRRLAAGLSQREVARRTGITQATLSHIETGAQAAGEKYTRAYAAFLDEQEEGR